MSEQSNNGKDSRDDGDAMGTQWAPSDTNGAGDEPSAVECNRCGHQGEPRGKGQCEGCGAFLPGNVGALVHGGRRQRPLADPEEAPLFQEWASDLGGVDHLTTASRVLLRRAAEADAVCQTALDYVMTSKEAVTATRVQTALDTLHKHTSTLLRVATLLGVDPQPKEVWR